MDEENLENIDPDEPKNKSKNKRKVLRKVKRKKSKKVCDGEQKDNEELQNFQVPLCRDVLLLYLPCMNGNE